VRPSRPWAIRQRSSLSRRSFGSQPASTTAREAPTAAPSKSARPSISGRFSALLMPRPAETTTAASVSGGRAETTASNATKRLRRPLASNVSGKVSIGEASATSGAGGKLVPRNDMTLWAVAISTSAFALPA